MHILNRFSGCPLQLLPRSGGTPDFPALIKYSCDLMTNVRFVAPARVSVPEDSTDAQPGRSRELMSAVLGGKPVLTMAFDDMVVSATQQCF